MVRTIKKYAGSKITIKGGDVIDVPEICQYCPHVWDCKRHYEEEKKYLKECFGKEYKKYIKRYDSPKTLEFKKPFENGNIIKGEVIHIDNFGNLITNIDKSLIKDGRYVKFKGNIIKIVESYSDVNEGETLALINSFNLLEIGVNLGNAEKLLKGKIGDKVYLIRRKNA